MGEAVQTVVSVEL